MIINSNPQCFTIGESLLDIVFKNNKVLSSLPGGSILNASISLRSLNVPVAFITLLAKDQPANLILDFLNEKGLNTQYIQFFNDGNTPLALAFLDENNNASYTFYKNYPAEWIKNSRIPIEAQDYLLFGSIFSIDKKTFRWVNQLARNAKACGAFTLYDPNIRAAVNEISYLHITENIKVSTMLRASIDDLKIIFGEMTTEKYYEIVKKYDCKYCIITNGSKNVALFTPKYHKIYDIPIISPVSSIGAGDTFNAAVLAFLYEKEITTLNLEEVPENKWDLCINSAINYAQQVCLSENNYL